MSETMLERVAKAICKSKSCEGFMCCQHPANMGRIHLCPAKSGGYDDAARATIEAVDLEQMIMRAYVRGVEWNEENPLDREYRFKAAGDYADAALSSSQGRVE